MSDEDKFVLRGNFNTLDDVSDDTGGKSSIYVLLELNTVLKAVIFFMNLATMVAARQRSKSLHTMDG